MDGLSYRALLIMGATGSGKTPFGIQLETQKLWDKKWHHFDFGEKLRKIASRAREEKYDFLSAEELSIIDNSLKTNSLLEDKDFAIAEKILNNFISEKKLNPWYEIVILNGLPRHVGQAEAIQKIIDVKTIIYFEASPSILMNRIQSDVGGDRAGRTDDSIEEIYRKLEIFKKQTMPLIDYYKNLDRTILQIEVEEDTIPLYIIQELKTMKSPL
ncbi:MAG: nucleoside monophosphate kinase [Spirochaetes bacterium]|nr:nucleoside monophosphate kinase [Spirochaetota bacterium]